MKKLFQYLSILLIFMSLNLNANSLFKEHKTKIISIDNNIATIKNFSDVKIGSSGVVIHNFDKKHSTIVAKAIVIDKNSDTATIRFVPFRDLKQDVLPVPKILPQIGDTAILNYLYNYALPITPNYQTYKIINKKHKNIKWLHPDLFAAKLFIDGNPAPTKKDFKKMCKDYNFSLLYFAINDKGNFVDCNSFKIIKQEQINTSGKIQFPFFTRIKDIKESWFSFGNSKITNYNDYYQSLIR